MFFCSSLQGGKYDAKALLSYCYYGGMIYTALKKFEKALYFYEVVSNLKCFEFLKVFLLGIFLSHFPRW